MTRSILFGAAAALALGVTTADGAERSVFTANNVLPGCKKIVAEGERVKVDENVYLSGLCVGMIYAINVHDYGGHGYLGCVDVPDEVTIQQQARVIVRYIETRPQRMHEPFIFLAMEAQRDAWPCRK
jgi:hypothetical protein